MNTRQRLATILLWCAMTLVGIMFGASVYQRISLIPEWGGDLPESVVRYFRGTGAGQAAARFWMAVTGPTAAAVILAVILNWNLVARRRWILWGAISFFLMLIWTAVYFIPKGVIPLMQRGADGMSPDAISQTARSWIFWDWFRMAGSLGAYLCLIKAATLQCTSDKPSLQETVAEAPGPTQSSVTARADSI